jgi:hypothetical protein
MASLDGATSFLELVGDLVADRKLCSTLKLVSLGKPIYFSRIRVSG